MRAFAPASLAAQIGIMAASFSLTPTVARFQTDSAAIEQTMHALNVRALEHVKKSEYAMAVRVYEEAMGMRPDSADLARSRARRWVQNNLAWLLATAPDSTVRDGTRALLLAQQLVAWRPDDPAYLDTFAAAYAELGRFDDAVKTEKHAVGGLRRGPLPEEYRRHLKSYEDRKPWREP